MNRTQLRDDQRALIWASLATAATWAIPFLGLLTLPIVYLNTHVHELFHALGALLTGGHVQKILVFASGSGMTPIAGGSTLIVASAGYVGAALLGALLIVNMRTAQASRTALKVLSVMLGISMLVWVRGDLVGLVSGYAWVLGLWLLATKLTDHGVLLATGFLGLQQCLHSVTSLLTLLEVSAFSDQHSDAVILAQRTGIPSVAWALAWTAFSVAMIAISLKGALLKRR